MAFSATTNTSFVATYDRSGQALSLFRSEPVRRIAIIPEQSSTTGENNKDKVTLSESGVEKSRQPEDPELKSSKPASTPSTDQQKTAAPRARNTTQELTPTEEKVVVQQLKVRDREVKTHEMAHLANAGQYARGGATYSYQLGPDGRRYAVGGEVPIDVSKEKTPEQTIRKMEAVKRAAMAPAEPSSADRSIAAAASATESLARQELQSAQAETAQTRKDSESDDLAADEKQAGIDAAASDAASPAPLDIVA
jgi:hypothetical protein